MTMIRYGTILLATAVLVTTGVAQQVLGNNKGKVRATNALATSAQPKTAAMEPTRLSGCHQHRDFRLLARLHDPKPAFSTLSCSVQAMTPAL
jgi:hypothetical protein